MTIDEHEVDRKVDGHLDSYGPPRPFLLVRKVDHSGVSGTGVVAEGVEFTDGTVSIRWDGEHCSTVVWDTLSDAMAVHGHGGDTKAVWVAVEP